MRAAFTFKVRAVDEKDGFDVEESCAGSARITTTELIWAWATGRTWFWPALCCAVALGAILVADPFNEAGFCDDWSYGRVAMNLAKYGRFEYNGWGSPLLLFQTIWALPWIKAFGFSFQVLQASMIPIALGLVLTVYVLGRQIGLPRNFAAFASLAVATSPLFLPLAATFMTDCCGALFSILCICIALKLVSGDDDPSVRWLWLLAAVGVIGGANRQIVWIAPIVLIPYIAWTFRRSRRHVVHAAAAYLCCNVCILTITHFFAQPYAPAQLTDEQIAWLLRNGLGDALNLLLNLLFVCVLMSLPVFCFFFRCLPRRPSPRLLIILVAALLSTLLEYRLLHPAGLLILTFEWGPTGALPAWVSLYLVLLANCFLVGAAASLRDLRRLIGIVRGDRTIAVFAVFSLGYLTLLIPGVWTGFAFDRYMLNVIPLIMVLALRSFSRYSQRIPRAAWLWLTIYGAYSVAATHDFAESLRTRIAVAHQLESQGINRYRISVGFEYDGWTQLERTGYVQGARFGDLLVDDSAKGLWREFWNHMPGYSPDFVVLNASEQTPSQKALLTKEFRAWLPPFQRSAGAWKRSDFK